MIIIPVHAQGVQEFLIKVPDSTSYRWHARAKQTDGLHITNWMSLAQEVRIRPVFNVSKSPLVNWFLVENRSSSNLDLAKLHNEKKILHYQQNNILKSHILPPDDSLYSAQWYHHKVQALEAWQNYTVNPDIIIAIIDTGIDYNHPDLRGSIWSNGAEDLNDNGVLDSLDINNMDDDGNGYIDDVIGWDFTDTKRFPDKGDFENPDNDPLDEYAAGHGTQIAGIIAAQSNNSIGISGLLPGMKVMNLRAGTAQGYLEEDDVAKAIIYALDNGARIINMSFGDVVVSRFLEDVIQYAYGQGAVMLASSGNSGSNEIHYPAGFPQTISIGATSKNDQLAGFSNWGQTLDLVAPGVDIIAPKIGGGYNMVNGTSFSAPMVTAAAGLILSKYPYFSQEQVRNVIKTTANDIGIRNSDRYSGSGLLNMFRLSQVQSETSLLIHYPASGSSTCKDKEYVIVTGQDPNLISLTLQYGVGDNPDQWYDLVTNYPYQMIKDTLGMINLIAFSDTLIVLRLIAQTWQGYESEYRSLLHVDKTAPEIKNITITNLIDENNNSVLISFQTDDICSCQIFYRSQNSTQDFNYKNLEYETRNHKIILNSRECQEETEFYISATNASEMQRIADNYGQYFSFYLDPDPITSLNFIQLPWTFPAGYLLPCATDFDKDGNCEVVLSVYDQNNAFGPVGIYEFAGDHFSEIFQTDFRAIPRATGDGDGDGKEELLLGFGRTSYLLEAQMPNSIPNIIIWQDTVNFWASTIADMDQDGKGEIIGRVEKDFKILETSADNQFTERFTIINPSVGENNLGTPTSVVDDLDQDGSFDFVFGDYDGDIIIYENVGDDLYQWRHTERLQFPDATNYLIAGNYFSQSLKSLIAGTHSEDDKTYEHELDVRYWQYYVIQAVENDYYQIEQDLNINGYSDVKLFDSGLGSATFSSQDLEYLFLAPYPNLYIFTSRNNKLIPLWHYQGAQSNTVLVHDFDKDGASEFYFNDGGKFIGFEMESESRPLPPDRFVARPVDTLAVELTWQDHSNSDEFIIYRGDILTEMIKYDSTSQTSHYLDYNVLRDSTYYYAIQSVDYSYQNPFSVLSPVQVAKPNTPAKVDSVVVLNERQCSIYFNEKMDRETLMAQNCVIPEMRMQAGSVIPFLNDWAILVSFTQSFPIGEVIFMHLQNVRDSDKVLLDQNSRKIDLIYLPQGDKPYLEQWHFVHDHILRLTFNMAMDTHTVLNKYNYQIEPSGYVQDVKLNGDSNKEFLIVLSENCYTGATGITSYLLCNNLKNIHGRLFTEGNRINLVTAPENLANIYIYPQPASSNTDWLMFANVCPQAEIDIFDINGHFVISLKELDSNGGVRWDLKNFNGSRVAAGVYLYRAKTDKETKLGKFTVIR